MGSLKNGLFGGFHGRIGNLVGYVLNGKSIIRTIGKSSKPLSPARKINCDRMSVVNQFLRPLTSFIKLGFHLKVAGTNRNYYNEAVSYNKKHAVRGEYPNAQLDYSKAMLSMGSLLIAEKPQIQLIGEEVEFSWAFSKDRWRENGNDRAMLLVYFPDGNAERHVLSGARRSEGKDRLYIGPRFANQRMEAYISFIKDDGSEISDSVYVGSIGEKEVFAETNVKNTALNAKEDSIIKKEHSINSDAINSTKNPTGTLRNTKLSARLKSQLQHHSKSKLPDKPN